MSSGAPAETGVSIRYPSVALLCVDSANGEQYYPAKYDASGNPTPNSGFRYDANSPAYISVNKQTPLLFGYMTRVSLTEVNLNWNIPNINKTNNTLTLALYDNSGVFQDNMRVELPFPGTKPQGVWYSLPKICRELEVQLNLYASLPGMTWNVLISNIDTTGAITTEQFSNNPSITITCDGGYFAILPCNVRRPTTNPAFPSGFIPAIDDDLTNMLGITPTIVSATNNISPIQPYYRAVVGSYASAQYTPYVDIVSNLLTKNQNVADNSTDKNNTGSKLARIYLNKDDITPREIFATYDASGNLLSSSDNAVGTSPFTLRREFSNPKVISWNTTENVDIIDIQVLDARGKPIPYEATSIQQILPAPPSGLEIYNILGNTSGDFQYTLQATEI